MSGFVSAPPSAVVDPDQPETVAADLVAGDAFYPGLSITAFRDAMRVPEVVTATRVRDALRGGMLTVRRELRSWKAGHVAAGAATLAAIDAEEVDGQNAGELLYARAVFAFAAADLAETHGEISATADSRDRDDVRTITAAEHRRNGIHAVRDLLGRTRTSVELI